MSKITIISAHADHNRDDYRFKREHTGEIIPSHGLDRPLWPILVVGLVLMVLGANLIAHAPNGGVALGGMILCGIGLFAVGAFTYLLGH